MELMARAVTGSWEVAPTISAMISRTLCQTSRTGSSA